MASKDRRERRKSAARRRAETHASGYETTCLRMPEGLRFFEMKEGVHLVDIVPYKAGKGNEFAEEGELYYERTYWQYKKIGVDEKPYVCSSKTFKKPDFIQEHRQKLAKMDDENEDVIKALLPKERQIFLMYSHKTEQLELLDCSYHLFGKLLDSRIQNSDEDEGWDLFYMPDEDGMTLRLTVTEVTGKYKYNEVTAIDFLPRKKPLPKEIINHGICLDDLLIEVPYDKMKAIFLGLDYEKSDDKNDDVQDEKEEDRDVEKPKTKEKKEKPVEEDEPEKKEKKEESPLLKAQEVGLKKGAEVIYEGDICTIAKISPDGTSLTLLTEDDDIIKAIGVAEVKIPKTKEKEEPKKDKEDEKEDDLPFDEDEKSSSDDDVKDDSDDDDEWDADWEDD